MNADEQRPADPRAPSPGHQALPAPERAPYLLAAFAQPPRVIRRSDSVATDPLIFESPRTRSTNSIGHLAHRQTGAQAPRHEVGLEDVARRLDRGQVDLLQRTAAEQPEAGGGVPDVDAEQQPHVEVAATREQLAAQRPVDHRAAGHPARADHEVGVGERVQEGAELLRLVRAVGVHLADHVVTRVERPGEAGEVRRTEAGLAPRGAARARRRPRRRAGRPGPGAVRRRRRRRPARRHVGCAARSRPTIHPRLSASL